MRSSRPRAFAWQRSRLARGSARRLCGGRRRSRRSGQTCGSSTCAATCRRGSRRCAPGEIDAAVLALAGLRRLNLESEVAEIFDADRLVPAPGQGAVAVQIRANDEALASLLAPLNDETAAIETTAERALLGFLEGGCQVPVGALARRGAANELHLVGLVASLDGRSTIRRDARAVVTSVEDAGALGEALARDMLDAGAREILAVIRQGVLPASRPNGDLS